MFLKRLEITGFKSFAQKTVFTFPDGIVGIVGPNGSGKSNVIDAVRWLLGEREAKNLRGGKIEDLIFSGTATKARMSYAQVSMVFDNTDGQIPLEYKEVVVSRSVSRSGTSQYYINDSEVRLKDIVDFFSKIKLGTKGLSVIGQGAGDIFVRASAQERMTMIQEILGLREYEIKKHQAQRKLSHTVDNLEKIQAMMQEVSPRLRMLKKQTSRWEQRLDVQKEYETLSHDAYTYILRDLLKQEEESTRPLESVEKTITALSEEYAEAKKKLEALEEQHVTNDEMEAITKRKQVCTQQLQEIQREIYKIEARRDIQEEKEKDTSVRVSSESITWIRETLKKILSSTSLEEAFSYVKEIQNTVETISPHKQVEKDTSQEEEKLYQEYKKKQKEIESELETHEKREHEISQSLQSFQGRFKEVYDILETIRQKRDRALSQRETLHINAERVRFKKEEIERQIREYGEDLNAIYAYVKNDAHISSITSRDEYEKAQRTLSKLRGELASIGDIDEAVVQEAQEVEAHYNHLLHEYEDLSKALEDIRTLITELEEKITNEFYEAFKKVNEAFHTFFVQMFGGGSARMKVVEKSRGEDQEGESDAELYGIDISLTIPRKKIQSLDVLSGGEKSLVSLAALFALISVSPPPFLVLDEVDSALDEKNSRRFSNMIKSFSQNTQFIVVTHNRVTMEVANALYGVTMDDGGMSKVLSLKLTDDAVEELNA